MAKMNFMDALNVKVGDIERPPLIPMGTYRAVVTKIPAIDEVGNEEEGWDTIDFVLRLLEPMEDVNPSELEAYGGLTDSSTIIHRFMFPRNDDVGFQRTQFNVKRFCVDHLKIDGAESMPFKQMLNAAANHQCQVFIKWQADRNDNEIQYNRVGKTLPL